MSKLSALPEAENQKLTRKLSIMDFFFWLFLVFEAALIIIFGTATEYVVNPPTSSTLGTPNRVDNYFTFYTHIALMVFIGFGFLMSSLKESGFGAIGLTFLSLCIFHSMGNNCHRIFY